MGQTLFKTCLQRLLNCRGNQCDASFPRHDTTLLHFHSGKTPGQQNQLSDSDMSALDHACQFTVLYMLTTRKSRIFTAWGIKCGEGRNFLISLWTCSSSSSEIHCLFPILQLQRWHLRRRRELVPLWVRPGVRRTRLPHQWVPGNRRVEGVRWAGGVRGERPWPGKREPIVWGRQIRKPFRKTGLTSRLTAEPRSELRSVRLVSALSHGLLGETLKKSLFRTRVLSNWNVSHQTLINPLCKGRFSEFHHWRHLNATFTLVKAQLKLSLEENSLQVRFMWNV